MSRAETTGLLAAVAGRVLRTRWIVRSPIGVYKARLGMLFGSRLCMIEHIGRNTGKPRYVVIEIVDRKISRGQQPSHLLDSYFAEVRHWTRPDRRIEGPHELGAGEVDLLGQ